MHRFTSASNESLKTGVSFGLTSGIITTLGLIVGLHSGTHSKSVVLGGILTIAVADSLSDALGIHIAQESREGLRTRQIWEATCATFVTKLLAALTFVVPIVFLSEPGSIIASVAWGMSLLIVLNLYLARDKHIDPFGIVLEHLVIAGLVVTATHFVGEGVAAHLYERGP